MRETHEVGLQSSFSIFFPTAGLKCHTQFRRNSHRFNLHYLDPVFLKSPLRLPPPCLCISLFLTHLHRISALNCSVLRIPLFFWAFCVCVCVRIYGGVCVFVLPSNYKRFSKSRFIRVRKKVTYNLWLLH